MTDAEYRTLRDTCGLSQQGAADFHGVAVRTIQHWESGLRDDGRAGQALVSVRGRDTWMGLAKFA